MLAAINYHPKTQEREIDGLLGSVADERFALLVNLGKKITDFGNESALVGINNEEQIDEQYGINVQFEESEDESVEDDYYGEIRDEGEEEAKESAIIHADTKFGGAIKSCNSEYYLY